jgi:linoleoyl-CoA desaturase
MEGIKPKFSPNRREDFFPVVKQRVEQYFKENKLSKYATRGMIIKAIILYCIYAGSYALIISDRFSWYIMLPLGCIMSLSSVMLMFNVAHDAVHNVFSKNKTVNKILAFVTFYLIGDNGNMWKIRHIQSHHYYVNIADYDIDIEVVSALRFSDKWPHKKMHRYQHIYAPFIYLFYSLYWVTVSDFKYLFKDRYLNFVKVRHPQREFRIWVGAKIYYYSIMLVIPMLVLSLAWWKILLGWLIMHMVNSVFILGNLLCTHLFDSASFVHPDDYGRLPHGWAVHQVENCQDFGTTSKFAVWILGGENTHTAHHLFPKIAHGHYISVTKIVKETAAEYGVHYHETTLLKGLASHFKMLKKFGKAPEAAAQRM